VIIPNGQAVYCLDGTGEHKYGKACVIPHDTPEGVSGKDIKDSSERTTR
jgi:hypothetical protein